ncbi:hypothetical protein GCM10009837_16430 [Streptomyces durmitorensis]
MVSRGADPEGGQGTPRASGLQKIPTHVPPTHGLAWHFPAIGSAPRLCNPLAVPGSPLGKNGPTPRPPARLTP